MVMDNIRIASANCKGFFTHQKRLDVPNFYKHKNLCIICLQEAHFIPEIELILQPQGVSNVFSILIDQMLEGLQLC